MFVDRHQTLIQCIQNIHALQKQLTERVRLIAQQFPLDPLRKPYAEQTADAKREQRDEQIRQQHTQHRPMVGAQIQPCHDDTGRLPVFIAHDSIGTAIRAVRHLIVREHRLFLTAQAADRISFQFGQQRCVACTGHKIVKHCRLALNIIHAEHIYFRYTLYGPRQILLCVICPNILDQQRRICRHLRRIGQQLVARPHLLIQADAQTDRRGQQHHHRNAQDQHPAHLPVQRAGGTCIYQIHPPLLRRYFIS